MSGTWVLGGAGTVLGLGRGVLAVGLRAGLRLDPTGGQGGARRNAWTAMSEAHQGSLARAEAEESVERAARRHLARRVGHPAGSARRSPLAR